MQLLVLLLELVEEALRGVPREFGGEAAPVPVGERPSVRLGRCFAIVTVAPLPGAVSISNRSISRRAPTIPRPSPVGETYSPSRIAWRFSMPGPRSQTRTTQAEAAACSTRNSALPPPAYWKALRAISDVAVAIRVWSSGGNPSSPAICRRAGAPGRRRVPGGFRG